MRNFDDDVPGAAFLEVTRPGAKRGALAERGRFFENEEVTMAEALRLAVEALRDASGGDPRMDKAAKMLDRRAIKARAREEAAIVWEEYCLCGNGKAAGRTFCVPCYSRIPVKMWHAFHTARTPEAMGAAMREMNEFVRGRAGKSKRKRRAA